MKNIILFSIAIIIVFTNCNDKKQKFKGMWMAYKVESMLSFNLAELKGLEVIDYRGNGSKIDSFVKIEENRLFSFEENGLLLDDGELFGQNTGQWQLTDEGKLVLKSVRGTEKFDIFKIRDKGIVLKKQYEKSKDSLFYTLVPFEGKNQNELKSTFQYLMTKPTQSENNEKIKERLKNALKFYACYFYTTAESKQVNSFRPSRIYLPVQFYSGGIGLKQFDGNADWVYLFYDTKDAYTAYNYLSAALQRIQFFPDKGKNFALEYAEVFNEMASYL